MEGRTFDRLTVLSFNKKDSKHRKYWNCSCSCGGSTVSRGDALTMGKSRSCGCLQREVATRIGLASRTHGKRADRSPTYNTWSHMIDRCSNPKNSRYGDYGGRGLTVCERWKSFDNFYSDIGDKPVGLTLERKDNELGYSPQNCVWASYSDQNRNRRPFGVGVRANREQRTS